MPTPGEWKHSDPFVATTDGYEICKVYDQTDDLSENSPADDFAEKHRETHENGCLIAAAPDLLAALEYLISRFGHDHWESVHDNAAIDQARAAVAKARNLQHAAKTAD